MHKSDFQFVGVSVVIPVLNERSTLPKALDSLLDGSYPLGLIELILVDGGSTDGTTHYLRNLKFNKVQIKLLHNPLKITPVSLNIGIEAARYDVILRADAHAVYDSGYVINSVTSLVDGLGDNIGGKLKAIPGDTRFSHLLAMVLNSYFGNAGAQYRAAAKSGYVDTVWCGCWYKRTLQNLGLFDQQMVTNQDAELNARLRLSGGKVYLNSKVRASLIVRRNYKEMVIQYYKYGKGRMNTLYRHSSIIKWRQTLPFLGVTVAMTGIIVFPIISIGVFAASIVYFYQYFKPRSSSGFSFKALDSVTIVTIIVGMNVFWVTGFITKIIELLFQKNTIQTRS